MSVTAQNLITKYESIFSAFSITSSAQIPQLVLQVLTLLPQVVTDVQTIEAESGDQQKALIVQIVNSGLKAAYDALATKLNVTEEGWDTLVEGYVTTILDYEINNILTIQNNKIAINQTSWVVRVVNFFRTCSCTSS